MSRTEVNSQALQVGIPYETTRDAIKRLVQLNLIEDLGASVKAINRLEDV